MKRAGDVYRNAAMLMERGLFEGACRAIAIAASPLTGAEDDLTLVKETLAFRRAFRPVHGDPIWPANNAYWFGAPNCEDAAQERIVALGLAAAMADAGDLE